VKLPYLLLILFVGVLVTAAPARAQDSAIAEALGSVDPSLAYDPNTARVGDFNADGLEDVAAIVAGPERRALVVFHPTPNGGYVAYPLYATLPPGDVDLRLVPAGRHRVLSPQGVVEHATPGIELIFPGRSSALYLWRNGRYQVFPTENY
jgi:hypothetical protein